MANQSKLAGSHQKSETASPRRTPRSEAIDLAAEPKSLDKLLLSQRALENSSRTEAPALLALQQTAGNRATSRFIQTKLMVGPAKDHYEQEADRVAEQIVGQQPAVSSGQPAVQRQGLEEEEVQTKPLAASITPLVQRQEAPEEEEIQTKPLQRVILDDMVDYVHGEFGERRQGEAAPEEEEAAPEEEEVQTKPLQRQANGSFEASTEIEQRLAANKGGGSPLPADTRAFMEPRFGADFSGVRVHTGNEADRLNRQMSAQAFTHGQDIYMGAGRYDPSATVGKRLLAHELTHVIQQSGRNDRIARWGGPGGRTSHEEVTQEASEKLEGKIKMWYSDDAVSYLKIMSEQIDQRVGFIAGSYLAGQAYGFGHSIGTGLGKAGRATGRALAHATRSVGRGLGRALGWMTRGKLGLTAQGRQESLAKEEERSQANLTADEQRAANNYDNIGWYWRSPSEAPNHGEAGKYRIGADGSTEDKTRVDNYLKNALQAWRANNRREALATLALGLHAAEDRGAHGDGRPGTGHDPRRVTPPPPGAKTAHIYHQSFARFGEQWQGDWCDRKERNPTGYTLAVNFAKELLEGFAVGLGLTDKESSQSELLKKGAKLAGFEQPGGHTRRFRRMKMIFGKGAIRS